ncbi:hypothetical protein J8M20_02300 [Pseudoalteromonas luteoviolacea]|uniref:hypothetical protein n=1 Tax=Pseudoalteromonas luteoviolacea TaxID=43657 RepID=UPI001B38DCDE|nr:hypothetical protein [Pseudoalteromonas luteoviolacea]MBQ4810143.1 hypothetical protein [Pseudoalteromonas luteoviolacea]
MIRSFLLGVICLLVVGCATTKSVKKGYQLNEATDKGVFVASISYQGGYSGYSIRFSASNGQSSGQIEFGKGMSLIPIPPKGDYSHIGRKGQLYVVELPAGDYTVFGWQVASGYATTKPQMPISINFKVQPGKATYIGNFDFVQTSGLGLTVTGVEVNYTEQSNIDLEVLKRRFPNINVSDVIMGIKPSFSMEGIGGENSTSWNMPMVIM